MDSTGSELSCFILTWLLITVLFLLIDTFLMMLLYYCISVIRVVYISLFSM